MPISEDQIKELLPGLKEALAERGVNDRTVLDDDAALLQFLRWKPTVTRASERIRAFLEWKKGNTGLFDESLRVTRDEELVRLLRSKVIVMGTYGLKTKEGSPILIVRLRNNDMSDGRTVEGVSRMMFYTIDRLLELPESCDDGITILLDLRGFNPAKNAHVGIPKTIFRAIFGHFPIRIKNIYLLNAPFVFHATFRMISSLFFPSKVKARCHFIKSVDALKDVLDIELLPRDLNGKNDDFSIDEWIEKHRKRELDGTLVTMTNVGSQKS
eukprot:scaffold781_cov132-Cylindrotheca_fusiformis.AAC.16